MRVRSSQPVAVVGLEVHPPCDLTEVLAEQSNGVAHVLVQRNLVGGTGEPHGEHVGAYKTVACV